VWPPPYDFAFDHLQKKEDLFVDNEDAYYSTDLENEDGEFMGVLYWGRGHNPRSVLKRESFWGSLVAHRTGPSRPLGP